MQNAHEAETDALLPALRGALESWVRGKLACPVRRGADGKGLGTRYLASGLPDSEGGRCRSTSLITGNSAAAYPTGGRSRALINGDIFSEEG